MGHLPWMDVAGLEIAWRLSERSVSDWRPKTLLYITIDFINTVHWGYNKFTKHKIKSSTRENYAIKSCSKHKMQEAAAGVTA